MGTMHEQLEAYLDSLERSDDYRVVEVLKSSDAEVTQKVLFVGRNGSEQGPFIRKVMQRSTSLGQAYERIWEEQRVGKRFLYIPRIIECYATEADLTVIMEYIAGETLSDALYRLDPSLDFATTVFRQLCDAMDELHTSFTPPLIHRDLKPSNVMLTGNGLVLIDFGIARSYREGAVEDTVRFGTKGYAPPEQFGYGQTSVRSDVYSMGMLLFYCLTEETPTSLVRENGFSDPRIPEPIRQVLVKATALDPADRYQSANELRQSFEHALSMLGTPEASQADHPAMAHASPSLEGDGSKRPPKRVRGIIWNASLLLVWIFFLGCTTSMVLDPTGSTMESYSLPARIILGYGIFLFALGALVYMVASKRWIKERIPALAKLTRGQEVLCCCALAIVIMFVSALLAQAFP